MSEALVRDINAWAMAEDAALAELQSSPLGLTTAKAHQRLDRFGANRLRDQPSRPVCLKFIDPLLRGDELAQTSMTSIALAAGTAASVPLLDEARKLAVRRWRWVDARESLRRIGAEA